MAAPRKATPTDQAPAGRQEDIPLADLARDILSRAIPRPRVDQIRRLAEAAVAAEEKRGKKRARPDGKKKGAKKRKLAKIPARKGKK